MRIHHGLYLLLLAVSLHSADVLLLDEDDTIADWKFLTVNADEAFVKTGRSSAAWKGANARYR